MLNLSQNDEVTWTGYTEGGKEIDFRDKKCLARKGVMPISGDIRYYIKRTRTGANAGKFYNPHWPLFDVRAVCDFTKVSEEAFSHYLKFLQSDNPVFLLHAERANA